MITIPTDAKSGVVSRTLATTAPDADGVVVSETLELPAFHRAVYFSADDRGEANPWPADANRELPWVVSSSLGELFDGTVRNRAVGPPRREGMAILVERTDGRVSALVATPGERSLGLFVVEPDGSVSARATTLGTAVLSGEVPLFAFATAPTPAAAFRAAWRAAIENGAVASSTDWRWKKRYDEPFEYLGWCSWEHYRKQIDAESMAAAVRELAAGDVPVRWVLIDDGHQIEDGLRLKSFAPDPAKFPDGWRPIVDLRDPASIRWMGLWHCFQGLWKTLDEENDFGDLNDDLARLPSGGCLPRGDEAAATQFYDRLIGSAADAGFDFVKIDVQASNVGWYRGTANAVEASAHNSRALETAVRERLPHGMINCMAHNALCLFSTRHSAVTRCSIDYHLNDADSIASHIVQSYTNTLFMGWSVWPDHDMFHSSDAQAGRMMAVSKALSGAPVYLSDAPSDIRADLVRPLCLCDGRLLRPLAPAAATPESTFLDALGEADRPYVVVAPLANRCAGVAAYNLVQEPTRVRGSLGTDAYRYAGMLLADDAAWEIPNEGLVAYEWYTGRATLLAHGTREADAMANAGGLTVDLGHLEDSLVVLCPVEHGWAAIGREDAYLSPAAVTAVERTAEAMTVTLAESGPLLVWSDRGHVRCDDAACTPLGDGLWRVELEVRTGERRATVTPAGDRS